MKQIRTFRMAGAARPRRPFARRAALAAVTATAALALAACGGDGGAPDRGGEGASAPASTGADGGTAAPGAHNAQDVAFAQGMIPHHRQALEMAELVEGRSASAGVKDLAARIRGAQDPEIRTMTGWLTSWDEPVPEAGGSMPGMDHSEHSSMPGMMAAGDMERLKRAEGAEFDRMFLAMMVEHHEGAVDMAEAERAKGLHGPAKTLADDVVTAQNAEITEMNELLGED
ncbi:DUF305 domain-containing protein [Streptomyces sp. SID8352]|uniref:DUF305 domain-containing protein n=1 Tax=Streptomyces sp. SID8352 TaxID=2690338 RepID=UPI001F287288|nr:DUF305 domain-containing protein [Streptomyces sp. SID8352]